MAGALSRRDIEMIFRAETDKATRPIGELTRDVKTLRSALEDQIKMADKGEVSLDKLASTTRDLKKAQEELGTARSLLTTLNGQAAALDKAEAKLDAAAAKYNDLKNQVDAAEKPTKRLTNSLEAAGRAQAQAADSVERIGVEVAQTRSQIEGIIGPVTNFGDSFRTIAETSRDIARGLAVAGDAADDFKQRLAAAQSDSSFDAMAMKSPVTQESINFISQFENRVELLRLEEQALEAARRGDAAAEAARKAKQRADIDDILGGNRQLEASFAAMAADQQRIEQVNAFRQIAADANAAATDVARFGSTADTTATSATRLADAILAITAPAAAANQSIDGLENSVKQATTVLDGEGKRSLQQYNVAMGELAAANAAAMRLAKDVDGYRTQQEALSRSTARFREAQAEVKRLAAALSTAAAPSDEMANALKRAEAQLEAAGREMQRDGNLAEQMGAKLRKAGVDVNDLAQAEKRLTQTAKEAAAAQREIAGKTGGSASPLGFSLQDMQNLGYQVNDLITQVASGTPIAQAFAQQFGQIYQIPAIQNLIARFAVFIPVVAAAAAAVGVFAAAVSRAGDRAEALKSAEAYIARIGEGGNLTAQQMADASVALQDFGVSVEDAFTILTNFNEAGLDPAYLDAFTQAVKNASDATGIDMPEAASLLTDALSGGYDEVVKLDEQFNFLTVSEREHIRAMYDSGQESEARRVVFDKFYESMDEGAAKMNGPWSNAVDNFKGAFRSFLDYLGSTTIVKDFIKDVNNALVGLNYLLLRARGFNAQEAGNAAVNGNGRAPQQRGGGGGDPQGGRSTGRTKEGQDAIADAQRELKARKLLTKEERLRNAEIDARRKAPKGASDQERSELAALARLKESNAIAEEGRKKGASAAKSAQSDRNKAAREAEALQNRIEAAQESLQSGLDGMEAKVARVAMGGITDALAAAETAVDKQYDKLYRKLDDFSKLTAGKGTIGGASIAEYRAQLDANKVILTQQAQLKVYEEQINAVLSQRKQVLAEIEERANRGAITSAQAIKEASEVTSTMGGQISKLADDALRFAQNLYAAQPSPELKAFIDKMTTVGAGADGQAALGALSNKQYGAEEAKLNQIIAERNALVIANNELVKLGAMSEDEANKAAQAAYARTQPLIEGQIAKMQELLGIMHNLRNESGQPLISDEAYAATIAKLQGLGLQAQYTDARVVQMRENIQNILAQNAVQAIDRMAQAFAGMASGAMSVKEGLAEIGLALLDFVAQTLRMIAQLIIQALIIKAIESATGVPLTAMLNMMYGNGSPGGGGGGGGAGGGGGGFFSSLFGSIFHGGTDSAGDVSQGRRRRQLGVSPGALASIPRYHSGTQGAGLKHNEMLAVLERGEKVQTEEQQRLEANRAGSGGSGGSLRQVLAFGDDQVAAAMQGAAGESVTVTHIRRNAPMIKQLLKD